MGNMLALARPDEDTWAARLHSVQRIILRYVRIAKRDFDRHWLDFCNWISQPHIRRRFIWGGIILGTALLIFALVYFGIPALGFGAGGIAAGSLAALFQGAVYAGAVPAGGMFALLTSIAMTGLIPLVATAGAAIAGAGAWVGLELFGQDENGV